MIEPTFTAAELDAARAEAWQAGSDAASAAAAAADHAAIRQTVAAVAEQLAAAHDELLDLAEQSATAIARLLLGSLGVVLPELAPVTARRSCRRSSASCCPGSSRSRR